MLSFVEVVEQLVRNPFHATSWDLVLLDKHDVMEQALATCLSQIREAGHAVQKAYIVERLENSSIPVFYIVTNIV